VSVPKFAEPVPTIPENVSDCPEVRDCGPVVYFAVKIGLTKEKPASAPTLKSELVVPVVDSVEEALFVKVMLPVIPPDTVI